MSHTRQSSSELDTTSPNTSGSFSDGELEQSSTLPIRPNGLNSFFKESLIDNNNNTFSVFVDDSQFPSIPNGDSMFATTAGKVVSSDHSDKPTVYERQHQRISNLRNSKLLKAYSGSISSTGSNTYTNSISTSANSTPSLPNHEIFTGLSHSNNTINTQVLWESNGEALTLLKYTQAISEPLDSSQVSNSGVQYEKDNSDESMCKYFLPNVNILKQSNAGPVFPGTLTNDISNTVIQEEPEELLFHQISPRCPSSPLPHYTKHLPPYASLEYHDDMKSSIEEAANLLKMEIETPAKFESKQVDTGTSSCEKSLHSHQTTISSEAIHSHQNKINKHTSLLSTILIPSPDPARRVMKIEPTQIPALRRISGCSQKRNLPDMGTSSTPTPIKPQENVMVELLQPNLTPTKKERNVMNVIYPYKNLNKFDLESFPVQHINSVSSTNPTNSEFFSTFSIIKILLVISCCVIVPPLFFLIALGPKKSISDERLMETIISGKYRHSVFNNYMRNVDLTWFRRLCLALGILEIFLLFTFIGIGFGIGINSS